MAKKFTIFLFSILGLLTSIAHASCEVGDEATYRALLTTGSWGVLDPEDGERSVVTLSKHGQFKTQFFDRNGQNIENFYGTWVLSGNQLTMRDRFDSETATIQCAGPENIVMLDSDGYQVTINRW